MIVKPNLMPYASPVFYTYILIMTLPNRNLKDLSRDQLYFINRTHFLYTLFKVHQVSQAPLHNLKGCERNIYIIWIEL